MQCLSVLPHRPQVKHHRKTTILLRLTRRCHMPSSVIVVQQNAGPDNCSRTTMENDVATKLISNTRMGEMCYPKRGCAPGGFLIGKEKDGVTFTGSQCMLFLKNCGMTTPHVDVQSVPGGSGEVFDMPAAGTIRAVNTMGYGKTAKRAIVVHADCREDVIKELVIDTGLESTSQYLGKDRTLEEFARALKRAGIKFVVIDFPWLCSYMLPSSCAHVFVTFGLVESGAWHPHLCGVDAMRGKVM